MSETPAEPTTHVGGGRDLTTGSIPRHLIAFSFPMLLGSLFQTAYSIVNAIWVGKFLGTTALAAVTISMPIFFVIIALNGGMTMAANILISQSYGAKDADGVRRAADSSLVVVTFASIALLAIGEIFTPAMLGTIGATPDVFKPAVGYMRIFLLSTPFGFGLFQMRNALQGIGDSKTPLYALAASVVLTAIMDPLLMFGWLGFPKLGLNGTAWASTLAQAAAYIGLMAYLQRKRSLVAPVWGDLRFSWPTVSQTVKIGLPAAVQQSLVSVGMVFVTGIVTRFGETATAAFGAAIRIDQLAVLPAMTLSMAISTLSGQNIGAQKHHRVKEIFKWGCALGGGMTVFISLLAVLFPVQILRMFLNDPDVIAIGVMYLRIVSSCYIFFAIMFVTNGIINGAGHTLMTTVISLVSLWIVRVPIAYYLSHRMHSVVGVWYGISLSFMVAMLVSMWYYLSGRWMRPLSGRRPVPLPEAPVE